MIYTIYEKCVPRVNYLTKLYHERLIGSNRWFVHDLNLTHEGYYTIWKLEESVIPNTHKGL